MTPKEHMLNNLGFTPELLHAAYQALSYVARHAPGPEKDAAAERALAFRSAIKASLSPHQASGDPK